MNKFLLSGLMVAYMTTSALAHTNSIDMFQGDFEYYDYRLGSSSNNVISITQSNN
jgi:hypothetical protein